MAGLSLHRLYWCLLAPGFLVLAGCADDETIGGQRIPVREIVAQSPEIEPGDPEPLPPAETNGSWLRSGGNALGGGFHPAYEGRLDTAWRYNTGSSANREWPYISQPAVADGVIVLLDPSFQVHALSAENSSQLWQTEVVPDGESIRDAVGGGVAIDEGRVYVATGFGEVAALDLDDGSVLWRARTSAPVHSAPVISRGLVATVARDDIVRVLDAETGEELWNARGAGAPAGFLLSASPVVRGGQLVVPFASGELAAYDLVTGQETWRTLLAGDVRDAPVAAFADVTAGPVIAGDVVYAGTRRGEFAAVDLATGEKVWSRTIGAGTGIWVVGDSVYAVDDSATLLRLSAANGGEFWRRLLPAFEDPDDAEGAIHYASPAVAGGRVLVGSSDGQLYAVDAASGEIVVSVDMGDPLPAGVAVASSTVYLFSSDGVLHAIR